MVNPDETPTNLAKLLIGLRNRPTTKTGHIAWKCVLKIFNATDPKCFILNSLKNFAPNIRRATLLKLLSVQNFNKLDRRGADITKIMSPALNLLLTEDSDVEVLDLTGLVSYSPAADRYDHLETAIIEVSERATNLLSLSILQEETLRFEEQILSPEFIDAFGKMEHLQVLRIEDFDIDFPDLRWLCEKLLDLRFVSVNISGCDFNIPTMEELQGSFELLRAFFFRSTVSIKEIIEFKNLCQMNLPNLQVIEDFASDFCCQSEYQYAPYKKEERNLRHLCLNLQYEKADEGLHELFPCVTHLKIEGPDNFPNYEWQIKPLLKFSKSEIESLHLSHVPPEIVLQFVTIYGPNLHSLFLGNSICPKHSESSLDRIFALCPKLQRVGLVGIEGPAIPKNDFTKEAIKEVILNSVILSDILMAPNLEKVTLIGQVVNEDDMRRLTDLISEKKTLRKLKTLVVRMQCYSIYEVKQPFFLAMADFIKTAARVLPALTEIQLRVNHICNYVILAESMRSGRFTNNEISGVELFFGPGTKFRERQWFVNNGLIDTLNKFLIL